MLKLIALAIVLDWIIGDPYHWPHPVRFFGWLIRKLEKWIRLQFKNLYIGGGVLWFGAMAIPLSILYGLSLSLPKIAFDILTVYLLFASLAAKCLKDEAVKVKKLIDRDALAESQKELGYLVGRDTNNLTKPQVLRGIIETVSENTVDGILAPLFYMIIGAPFGMTVYFAIAYKIVNTLDSMVGYKQEPYGEIGFVSAKIDDVFNYIPARLGAILMLISGGLMGRDFKNGLKVLIRDRRNHKSPNCGYPEATTAGLLNIQLGGTNTYFGEEVVKPTLGDPNQALTTSAITDSVRLIYLSESLFFLVSYVLLEVL